VKALNEEQISGDKEKYLSVQHS